MKKTFKQLTHKAVWVETQLNTNKTSGPTLQQIHWSSFKKISQ